jgi:polysaccharide export outer membrane protein
MLATALVLVSGCEGFYGNKTSMKDLPADGMASGGPAVLQPGDIVKISFSGAPEYNGTQKVASDGNLSLPLIGEVHAAGKSVGKLQSELSDKYESQLQNNDVVVTLESAGTSIIITGGVRTPGKVALDRPTTLLDVIFMAGGFNEFANRSKVRVIRLSGGEYVAHTYDLTGAMHGKVTSPVYVRSGDLIAVDERTW